jgi:hypothetical protein
MSIRCQQQYALYRTRKFMRSILSEPRRSQKELKLLAGSCLHHFPPLDERGAPMFSKDEFECPVIMDENEY